MRSAVVLAFCAAVLTVGAACNGDTGDGTGDGDGDTAGDGDGDYQPGMQVDGDDGQVTVILVEADPGPPERGDNTWTLQVEDDTGLRTDLSAHAACTWAWARSR